MRDLLTAGGTQRLWHTRAAEMLKQGKSRLGARFMLYGGASGPFRSLATPVWALRSGCRQKPSRLF
eukprot:9330572-Alexandrium_andersonii.AAC.1